MLWTDNIALSLFSDETLHLMHVEMIKAYGEAEGLARTEAAFKNLNAIQHEVESRRGQ